MWQIQKYHEETKEEILEGIAVQNTASDTTEVQ